MKKYAGPDVSLKEVSICVVDEDGKVLAGGVAPADADGTEVDRSRKNGWDVADAADPANDIGDDPPPNTIMRR